MTDEKIVINLLRDKEIYKEAIKHLREALTEIHIKLVSIGAPLNENTLAFNKKQLDFLFDIDEIIKNII